MTAGLTTPVYHYRCVADSHPAGAPDQWSSPLSPHESVAHRSEPVKCTCGAVAELVAISDGSEVRNDRRS